MSSKLFSHPVYRRKVVLVSGGCSGIGRAWCCASPGPGPIR